RKPLWRIATSARPVCPCPRNPNIDGHIRPRADRGNGQMPASLKRDGGGGIEGGATGMGARNPRLFGRERSGLAALGHCNGKIAVASEKPSAGLLGSAAANRGEGNASC